MSHIHEFSISPELIPSEHLADEATQRGVGATALMRDFVIVRELPSATTVAVGDMANNLVGKTEHVVPKLAEHIGFSDPKEPLNGGLVGSHALREELSSSWGDETGPVLVTRANAILERTYETLKMPQLFGGDYIDPATLFTGYLTHARIRDDVTTITSVGDVYAWVNGELVAGAEKPVDTHKERLVRSLTDMVVDATAEVDFASIEEAVRRFGAQGAVPGNVSQRLLDSLSVSIRADCEAGTLTRQTVYRPVDSVVTPWQIRELQNHPSSSDHPWRYGAIDGRLTPREYVTVREIPTAEIDTLVLATDGSAPRRQDGAVHGLDDLAPVNPTYSERGMVAVRRQ